MPGHLPTPSAERSGQRLSQSCTSFHAAPLFPPQLKAKRGGSFAEGAFLPSAGRSFLAPVVTVPRSRVYPLAFVPSCPTVRGACDKRRDRTREGTNTLIDVVFQSLQTHHWRRRFCLRDLPRATAALAPCSTSYVVGTGLVLGSSEKRPSRK